MGGRGLATVREGRKERRKRGGIKTTSPKMAVPRGEGGWTRIGQGLGERGEITQVPGGGGRGAAYGRGTGGD